jgi:dephospho-CoA kinase
MLVVGLTGGIASGKTTVARMLKKMGARIIDADAISKEVMVPHTRCWRQVVKEFGEAVVRADGTIDRKKLAAEVFTHPEKRMLLNRIVHPCIRRRIREMIRCIGREDPAALVIIEAALLVETGMYRDYDKLVVVAADTDVQLARLMRRNRLSIRDARRRLRAQWPLARKKRVADYVISNQASLQHTRRQTRALLHELGVLLPTDSPADHSRAGKRQRRRAAVIKNT